MRKKASMKRHAVTQPLDPSYKIIPLTQGKNALVDASDYEWLMQWNWCAHQGEKNAAFYAIRFERLPKKKFYYMHKEILGYQGPVDHRNGDGLDNRRANIRPATVTENARNMKSSGRNTSGFKGAIWVKDATRPNGGRWSARIRVNGKLVFLGYFASAEDAGIAYNEAALKYFGEFANINKIK